MSIVTSFQEQQKLVNYFFEHLDHQQVEQLITLIKNCSGLVVLTGMGKSGIIARNISHMLVSTGYRSLFLSPADALHGDVGILSDKDLVLLFSKSGSTEELINLVPACRNKGSTLVALVSKTDSKLGQMCDYEVVLPLERELCPFDLAPTTSAIIQLILGNTIVAHLMTNLSQEEYAFNHPAGRIGKRLTCGVQDIMIVDLPLCLVDDQLVNKISLMSNKKCGCLLIVDDKQKLLGIFTDGDLRRALEQSGIEILHKSMGQLMHTNPFTISKSVKAYQAMKFMELEDLQLRKKRVKELPVVDEEGKLVGLVSLHDMIKFGL